MPYLSAESVGRINLPLIIPDDTHSTAPSAYANENMTGQQYHPSRHLMPQSCTFILLPHDEEQPQSTLSDNESTMAESVHDKRTWGTVDHPHVLSHAFNENPSPLVQITNARGQLALFRTPDRPCERLHTSYQRAAGDDLVASDALKLTVETPGPSSIELDGGMRDSEADHVLGETLDDFLKSIDISIHRDNLSPKVKACTTIH
ncbi:hypothetical protein LXA43DRAFT_1094184 [Ganoderma leucocontextum]|nr:hypothetical protein LXA43DRAFT_1094184 [Ganoderma leucocontextum]